MKRESLSLERDNEMTSNYKNNYDMGEVFNNLE